MSRISSSPMDASRFNAPSDTRPAGQPAQTGGTASSGVVAHAWASQPNKIPDANALDANGQPDDADTQAALKEAGSGISFDVSDFKDGQNTVTKSQDGITATATYDPQSQTINANETDGHHNTFTASATGEGAAIHFGQTTEGQGLVRTTSFSKDAKVSIMGSNSETANNAGGDVTASGDGGVLGRNFASLTTVLGDKRAISQATGTGVDSQGHQVNGGDSSTKPKPEDAAK